MELECGPLGSVVDADGRVLVVPSFILNFGIAEHWEVVLEGRNFLLVQPVSVARRDTSPLPVRVAVQPAGVVRPWPG
jgi:hypothetical protein